MRMHADTILSFCGYNDNTEPSALFLGASSGTPSGPIARTCWMSRVILSLPFLPTRALGWCPTRTTVPPPHAPTSSPPLWTCLCRALPLPPVSRTVPPWGLLSRVLRSWSATSSLRARQSNTSNHPHPNKETNLWGLGTRSHCTCNTQSLSETAVSTIRCTSSAWGQGKTHFPFYPSIHSLVKTGRIATHFAIDPNLRVR